MGTSRANDEKNSARSQSVEMIFFLIDQQKLTKDFVVY